MTDMITVSRKEIEKLRNLTRYSFLSPSEGGVRRFQDKSGAWVEHYEMFKIIEDLLDKAEVSEPVASDDVENLEAWIIKNMPVGTVIGDPKWWSRKIHNVIAFTSPPDQSAKIAELEAEIARLKAIT